MASRPTRSTSIPIPRNNTRSIDSVISIPSYGSPSRLSFNSRSSLDDHRGVRPSSVSSSNARSLTFGARASPQSRSSVYEPRVIRAGSSRSVDASCLPSPSPADRNRRSSTGGGSQTTRRSTSRVVQNTPQLPPKSFIRPSYLDHSAFRNLLQPKVPDIISAAQSTTSALHSGAVSDSEDDRSVSPPPQKDAQASLPVPDRIMNLPTRWSEQTRHTLLSVSTDGRELAYQGANSNSEREAAAARTVESIPPACGIYYYEAEIRSKGQKAHISIGFSGPDVRVSRLPGWEPNSWGYHGDDGRSFATETTGTPFGPTFGLADVIGCGIDFTTHKVFYTKNGALLGHVFENVGNAVELYPAVGLQQSGDSIAANFGQEPFKYDIDFHVQQQKNNTWYKILGTPLSSSSLAQLFSDSSSTSATGDGIPATSPSNEDSTKSTLNDLILSYLAHHGYTKTAEAFQRRNEDLPEPSTEDHDMDMDGIANHPTSAIAADIELRTKVVNSITSGDVDTALKETEKHHPAVLEAEEGLMLFKLRCRKFIEMILQAVELKKRLIAVSSSSESSVEDELFHDFDDEMDVDEDTACSSPAAAKTMNGFSIPYVPVHLQKDESAAQYEQTLQEALSYGQTLRNDYKNDARPEVETISNRTFGILAWHDPLNAAAEVVGQAARVALASELNQAILKSQGKPTHPQLETLYRHTAVCVQQLGMLGEGAAAFADLPREFLDAP